MPEITLFCEDSFHERLIGALLDRFSREYGIDAHLRFRSARGGLPKMDGELKDFLRDLSKERAPYPDRIIVVADANCLGYNGRRALMENCLNNYPQFQQLVSLAIPDPHIERWMLVDPVAFKSVFGRGCTLPRVKCKKDEYKRLLRQEIRQSGIEPSLGGEEYAEEMVNAMDLAFIEQHEQTFGLLLKSLKGFYNAWSPVATTLTAQAGHDQPEGGAPDSA
jgi:hypothetical protein